MFCPTVAELFLGPRAILTPEFAAAVELNAAELDAAVVHARDFEFYLYILLSSHCQIIADCHPVTLYRLCTGPTYSDLTARWSSGPNFSTCVSLLPFTG